MIGLALTLFGAGRTARAVFLREEDAIRIGQARFGSDSSEENLRLPAVQNLLASSRGAQRGLRLIAAGTLFQMVPIVGRLMTPA